MAEITLLFVCLGNSCRSPMAEAMARELGNGRVDARSAGLTPLGWIAEDTVNTLRGLGYDASGLQSKGLDEIETDDVDIVISLLGSSIADVLPIATACRRINWSIPDPFGEDIERYRKVAQMLEARIRALLDRELGQELLVP
jgi:arsenate reductase